MNLARINFFKGLFTTAEDWQKEQEYHIEKRKLHSRNFHTPGIVKGEGADYKVTVGGNEKLLVQPGYAVDGHGRDLYLDELTEVAVAEDLNRKGKQGYIWIAYAEEQCEHRHSHLDADKSGFARCREKPLVKCTGEEPDNRERIEIGRFELAAARLTPGQEIDISHVKYAGTKQSENPWVCIQSGEADVDPADSMEFSEEDSPYIIEVLNSEEEAMRVAYVANAFPVPSKAAKDAQIHCRIVSSIEQKRIAYHLYLKNVGKTRATVKYVVYRLNISSMP